MLEKLIAVLEYIKVQLQTCSEIDLNILDEIIEEYTLEALNDPEGECPFESSMLGDIEVAYYNAEANQ